MALPPPPSMPPASPPSTPQPTAAGRPKPPAPGAEAGPGGPPNLDAIKQKVAGMLPEPESGGYSYKLLTKLAAAVKASLSSLFHKDIPVEAGPKPPKGDQAPGKLPLDLMVAALVLCEEAGLVPEGADYACNPADFVDDGAVRLLLAKITKMGSDKKLAKAIAKAMGGGEPDGDEAKPPAPPPQKAGPAPKAAASYMA